MPGIRARSSICYAIKFNPVFGRDDYSFFADESVPRELFDETDFRNNMVALSGGRIKQRFARRGCATRTSTSYSR